MASQNPEVSRPTYSVFRKLVQSEQSWTLNAASKEWSNIAKTTIQRARDDLQELGLITINRGPRNAKEFSVDYRGVADLNKKFLEIEHEIPEEFIEKFVSYYCSYNKFSTIRRMLRDDFVSYLQAYAKSNEVPNWYSDFLDSDKVALWDNRIIENISEALQEVEE